MGTVVKWTGVGMTLDTRPELRFGGWGGRAAIGWDGVTAPPPARLGIGWTRRFRLIRRVPAPSDVPGEMRFGEIEWTASKLIERSTAIVTTPDEPWIPFGKLLSVILAAQVMRASKLEKPSPLPPPQRSDCPAAPQECQRMSRHGPLLSSAYGTGEYVAAK